ncbi:hypothetical protein SDC9_172959 [bioreactor metagenome]|uniref:Uncharacterized protein n=1 Tax=bioreactor metagenome TaxID=1076179 RepID=A0A645GF53_9ZZZZ
MFDNFDKTAIFSIVFAAVFILSYFWFKKKNPNKSNEILLMSGIIMVIISTGIQFVHG